MATIAVAPLVIKDCLLTIGAGTPDNYEKHISRVIIEPVTGSVSWQGGTPDAVINDAFVTGWNVTIDYAQDWETTNSLAQYLLTNAGTSKPLTFTPKKGTGQRKATVTATILPGPFGGGVNAVATASVTMPVQGVPTVAAIP